MRSSFELDKLFPELFFSMQISGMKPEFTLKRACPSLPVSSSINLGV